MVSTVEERVVEVENVGPVERVSIPVPEGGGVVVLRGRNGSGKSRTLGAVENLISGRGKPDVRDGALSGSVHGFGVTLKLARSARRSGELEVTSLDGRLSVAELVDPQIKSPEAADAKRIKALIAVSGISPSVDMFYELFGGREGFEDVASSAAVDAGDVVAMADRIKRDCEALARQEESRADHEDGRAQSAIESAGEIDEAHPIDADELQHALEIAIEAKSRLVTQLQASEQAHDATELARYRLEKASSEYAGKSLSECRETEAEATAIVTAATERVREAELALSEARQAAEQARNQLASAIETRKHAECHESMVAQWREQLDASIPARPTSESIAKANDELQAARDAVERGAVIRAAMAKRRDAEAHASAAMSHRREAKRLRDAAKGTDDVLSTLVARAGSPLRVEAGRLVLSTKRGDTYYGDLSHGERWRIALDVAIQAVGSGGVIVLHQEAWEGLDPIARTGIADQVRSSNVVIVTAECSSDEQVMAEVIA